MNKDNLIITEDLSKVSEFERIAWDFDQTLYCLDVDWVELKISLAKMLKLPHENLLMSQLVDLARERGQEKDIFSEISRREIQSLERGHGLLQDRFKLFCELRERSFIVTNNMSDTIKCFFRMYNCEAVPFITRDMVKQAKPNPEGMMLLKEFWENHRTVLVGDSAIDQALAQAVGISFIKVGG